MSLIESTTADAYIALRAGRAFGDDAIQSDCSHLPRCCAASRSTWTYPSPATKQPIRTIGSGSGKASGVALPLPVGGRL
ncbi:hypothetical protein EV385_4168 [Krasilnikovia cinnamomea]|uniref:Uncharacterized protein n=1 Tax=Krasilnikovia cinnamomea TaxID=349313 RepID=A0A4V2G7F2_9ACTN|nr:hypothetical protein [Krasilnikovia cinnamomea]RZU52316.1 hypothetical protein EV385_4168 [Krasilnikovia cinnamomea]